MDPQRRQQGRAGHCQPDRQRLQRQPDQEQGQGPGLPPGCLQRRRDGRRHLQEAALHPGHRRPYRPQLGMGRLPGQARPAPGLGRQAAAQHPRQMEGSAVLDRLLRRRAGPVRPQIGAGRRRAPGGHRRQALDRRPVQPGSGQAQGVREVPDHLRPRHRRPDPGVVDLRLLPVPPELRGRPDRPQQLHHRLRGAQRRQGHGLGNWTQGLIKNKYSPAKSGTDPFADFVNGKSAMVWSGSWSATNLQKVKDGVVMPPPDFGAGPKIGGGSWQWGISSGCQNTAGALDYLKFSLQPKYLSQFVTKLNLIPATEETAAMSPGWEQDGAKRFFLDESQKFALIRPPTPAYPYITTTFAKAAQDIVAGGDAKKILDQAAKNIDQNLKSNNNYGA